MASFFPRHTLEIKIEEPKAFRRLSFSLVEMAVITGVLLRVYRLFAFGHASGNWLYVGGAIALGVIFLVGMTTAHLANYPMHQYAWRAPVFVAIEVAAEMAVSALLIAVGREANGSVRAHWDDWVGMATSALWQRGLAVLLWTAIVAAAITIARRLGVEDDAPDLTRPPSKT